MNERSIESGGDARFARLNAATAHLDPPFAIVDLAAFRDNAADLVRRSGSKPIRLATKSVRCRALIESALRTPGFRGCLAFSLAEALWLADTIEDIVVGYPTADRASLRQLAQNEEYQRRVTLMIDSTDQLDLIDGALGRNHPELRVCVDVDASYRLWGGRIHVGVHRSPVRKTTAAASLARVVRGRGGFRLVGLMAYEAQIAGVGDNPPGRPFRRLAIWAMKQTSLRELRHRRAAVVAAVAAEGPLEFVNGGGTGSLETTASEPVITETTAGSGLYVSGLFDHYRSFRPNPAAFFAVAVVRKPAADVVTLEGGGWIASGAVGGDRMPVVAYPPGLSYFTDEGAGEVQTPLRGPAARGLVVGDRVWLRHAKAGELCEHVNVLHLVEGNAVVDAVPTYRGEGRVFL